MLEDTKKIIKRIRKRRSKLVSIAYKSKNIEPAKPLGKSETLPFGREPLAITDEDYSVENYGRGGYNMPGEMARDANGVDPSIYDREQFKKPKPINSKELMKLFISLSDSLDSTNQEENIVMADFSDFIIKKVAEVENSNPTEMFNSLLMKINTSGIVNTNNALRRLAKMFSNTIVSGLNKNISDHQARKNGYDAVLAHAEVLLKEEGPKIPYV